MPSVVEIEVSLHQLYRGCHKQAKYMRKEWDNYLKHHYDREQSNGEEQEANT